MTTKETTRSVLVNTLAVGHKVLVDGETSLHGTIFHNVFLNLQGTFEKVELAKMMIIIGKVLVAFKGTTILLCIARCRTQCCIERGKMERHHDQKCRANKNRKQYRYASCRTRQGAKYHHCNPYSNDHKKPNLEETRQPLQWHWNQRKRYQ